MWFTGPRRLTTITCWPNCSKWSWCVQLAKRSANQISDKKQGTSKLEYERPLDWCDGSGDSGLGIPCFLFNI